MSTFEPKNEFKKNIPKGYEKLFMITDDKRVYDVFYNPKEKDPIKAYLKIEVK